jgi:hypothetical protein
MNMERKIILAGINTAGDPDLYPVIVKCSDEEYFDQDDLEILEEMVYRLSALNC